jgi:hypothetical protein
MKKLTSLVSFIIVLAFSSFAQAEPIKLKNFEAAELLTGLSQIGAGLTAQNTTRVARNINALRPIVDAITKGDEAAQTRLKVNAATKKDSPEGIAYLAEQKKNATDEVTVELQKITITDEEITAAKITPVVLSTVLLYLDPSSKPATVAKVEAAK